MVNEEYENYAAQVAAQKDIARAQGDENIKPHLPTIHQQMQESQAVVLEQINPRKIVAEIILELLGKEIDMNGQTIQVGNPLVNDMGLKNLKIKLKSVINQGTVMSLLDEQEIRNIMIKFQDDLCLDIALNWRDYGIESRNVCDTIMDLILINTYTTLNRAKEQNEKRFLGKVSFESVNSNSQNYKRSNEGAWGEVKKKLRL